MPSLFELACEASSRAVDTVYGEPWEYQPMAADAPNSRRSPDPDRAVLLRAMQIIDELEREKRSLYAGCVGYFSAGEQMDTCIALRTALLKDGKMYVQAGAGIVADSQPEYELQECINKAMALFRAADEAKRFASAAWRGE